MSEELETCGATSSLYPNGRDSRKYEIFSRRKRFWRGSWPLLITSYRRTAEVGHTTLIILNPAVVGEKAVYGNTDLRAPEACVTAISES